ncbi:MAG: hypothetical protein AAFP20_01160 [Cyanobacteria bacterium J06614_10]
MGLFEFVFGKGAPKDDTAPKQAYYLDNDDAKTFGNIEYMRSSKVVKRTFAKKKGETEHMESVRSISATKMTDLDGNASNASVAQPTTFGNTDFLGSSAATPAQPAAPAASTPAAPAESAPKPTEKRKPSSSNDMDLFRNMAKDIRR